MSVSGGTASRVREKAKRKTESRLKNKRTEKLVKSCKKIPRTNSWNPRRRQEEAQRNKTEAGILEVCKCTFSNQQHPRQ